jgi:transcription elongation factor GreA
VEKVPITRDGFQRLKAELERLKSVERPAVIRAIEEARSHGDLSENAEYEAAKERQGFIENRVSELDFKLGNADVIDPGEVPKDRVVFASQVLLENVDSGEEVEYRLVGPDESDVSAGKISVTSPLGRAMLGKQPGDEVVLQAPGGKRVYELVEIL